MKKLIAVVVCAAALCGCHFYENSGSKMDVGDTTILPRVESADGNFAIDVYTSLRGARVWTAKDSKVRTEYHCDSKSSTFGIFSSTNHMDLIVEVEPLNMN